MVVDTNNFFFFFVLRRPIFADQFYNEKLVTDVLKTRVKEWLRVHGDHVKSEAVEKAITQIMMGEEAEEMSSRAKLVIFLLRFQCFD